MYVLDATGLPDLTLEGQREIRVAAGDIVSLPVQLSVAPENCHRPPTKSPSSSKRRRQQRAG